jgi:hypothetical protein
MPWGQAVRTCRQRLHRLETLWTGLKKPGIETTNNAAERPLRRSTIPHQISHEI